MKADSAERVERSIITTYRSSIWKKFVAAINEYRLIEDGDRIAVCVSGGKDSMLMAKCFQELKKHGKNNFDAVYIAMDPGYSPFNRGAVENNAELLGIPLTFFESDIFDVIEKSGGAPCYLCARMRRGFLYSKAQELGCNKIALGHHFDDVIETILMGILYNGRIRSMLPKLDSANFKGMRLIRPMYRVLEQAIINWKNYNGLNFIQCACPLSATACGGDSQGAASSCSSSGNGSKRQEIKWLIKTLKKTNPNVDISIFKSAYNVDLDTVIGYKKNGVRHSLFDSAKTESEEE